MKQKFIHIFSYRDEKVPDKVWRARRVKTGKREKERTQKSTYVYQSKTKRSGEQRRLALAKDQNLKVAVAF